MERVPGLFLREPDFILPTIRNRVLPVTNQKIPALLRKTKNNMLQFFLSKKFAWPLVVLYAAFIFYLSSMPLPRVVFPIEKYHTDWLIHGVEYSLLAIFLLRALVFSYGRVPIARLALAAFLFSLLYAASDEWHQSFVVSRDSSVYDWIADGIGSVCGIFFWLRKDKKRHA